ncbi:MAG: hypothetical protein IIA66_04140 [Planctomycetes bacterium]|nr:hypothetical protein [Planctomycetota bacterium]
MADVQQIIERIGSGDASAEELLPLVYEELRTLARGRLAREARIYRSGASVVVSVALPARFRVGRRAALAQFARQLPFHRRRSALGFRQTDRLDAARFLAADRKLRNAAILHALAASLRAVSFGRQVPYDRRGSKPILSPTQATAVRRGAAVSRHAVALAG